MNAWWMPERHPTEARDQRPSLGGFAFLQASERGRQRPNFIRQQRLQVPGVDPLVLMP